MPRLPVRRALAGVVLAAFLPALAGAAAFPPTSSAVAQDASGGQERALAFVEPQRVGIEDVLTLTVSVPEERGGAPRLPDLPDFELLGAPSRFQRTEIRGSRVTRMVEWRYQLRPRRTGDLSIPPIPVPGYAASAPVSVAAVPGTVAPRRRRSPAGSMFDRIWGAPGAGVDPRAQPFNEGDVFVLAEPSAREVHVGEQVLVLYRLYARVDVFEVAPAAAPQPEGFWTEEVILPDVPWAERGLDAREQARRRALPGPKREQRERDGRTWNTWPLAMRAVFPAGEGVRELPGPTFQVRVAGGGGGVFGRQTRIIERTAPAVTITARPIPSAGRPPGFRGDVGRYALQARLLRDGESSAGGEAPAGEPLILRVELEGVGNPGSVEAPALPESPEFRFAFRAFDPDSTVESGLRGRDPNWAFGGSRTWDFPLVPEVGGDRVIPPVALDVFDPGSGAFERLETDPIPIRIEGGDAAMPAGAGPAEVVRFSADIRYLKPLDGGPGSAGSPSEPPTRSPWGGTAFLFAALALPVAWNLAIFAARRRRAHRDANRDVFRRRGALRSAERALSGDALDGAGVSAAVYDYAADKLGASARGLTPDAAGARLRAAGASVESEKAFRDLLARCDAARYRGGSRSGAAGSAGDGGGDGLAEEARRVLRDVDREIGRRRGR